MTPCGVCRCPRSGEWVNDDGAWLCEEHSRLFMTDDREDFAEEYARDARDEVVS